MSPENLGSSSVRKANSNHLKSSKEDENCPENGRISSNGNTSTLSPPTQHQHQHQHEHEEEEEEGHEIRHNNNNSNSIHNHESSPSRDVLLQWGQRKRSRCSRTESRSMATTTSEKLQTTTMAMAMTTTTPLLPPSVASTSSNGGSRTVAAGGRVRPNNGLLHSKDSHAFLPSKNRNVSSDQMVCSNGASPSRNGVGSSRASVSRSSIGKRSPSCVAEKNAKKACSVSASMKKVKSDDSLGNHHHHQGESGELQENNNGGHHHHHQVAAEAGDKVNNGELVAWPRIYLSLSRKEKEDDFYAMKGTKLPHRPKKRAKAVDRALQYCFPGLWLSDLTRARYEVRERKSAKKPKRRGLKGLENMESESE